MGYPRRLFLIIIRSSCLTFERHFTSWLMCHLNFLVPIISNLIVPVSVQTRQWTSASDSLLIMISLVGSVPCPECGFSLWTWSTLALAFLLSSCTLAILPTLSQHLWTIQMAMVKSSIHMASLSAFVTTCWRLKTTSALPRSHWWLLQTGIIHLTHFSRKGNLCCCPPKATTMTIFLVTMDVSQSSCHISIDYTVSFVLIMPPHMHWRCLSAPMSHLHSMSANFTPFLQIMTPYSPLAWWLNWSLSWLWIASSNTTLTISLKSGVLDGHGSILCNRLGSGQRMTSGCQGRNCWTAKHWMYRNILFHRVGRCKPTMSP